MLASLAIAVAALIGTSTFDSAPIIFTVTPAAEGKQLVRTSLPFPKGFLKAGQGITVTVGGKSIAAAVRPLTYHPVSEGEDKSVRRGMVTFPYTFKTMQPVSFEMNPAQLPKSNAPKLPVKVGIDGDTVRISYKDGPALTARIIAPARASKEPARVETVESSAYYLWQRYHLADANWPRVIEVRADSLGGVVVVAHLQRCLPEDDYAPDIGWSIEAATDKAVLLEGDKDTPIARDPMLHEFKDESPCAAVFGDYSLYHPAAPIKQNGRVEAQIEKGKLKYRYIRCEAGDKVPMQPFAWRRCEFVIAPSEAAPLTVTLQPPHQVSADWRLWDQLYAVGEPLNLKDQPVLRDIMTYHRNAVVRSVAHGNDWGNITSYSDSSDTGGAFGMNRLNHCPPIFFEGYESGDRRLVEAAVLWCDNMYDASIWWGPDKPGGTRYNNATAHGEPPPLGDTSYMWRSSKSVGFCTKGYDSFFIAYEETGDPRMKEALDAQVTYASVNVTADHETRNIGDVRDFIRLYEYTGEKRYLDNALRLMRDLRPKVSTGDLFDQGGKPLDAELPFINSDATGGGYGYAKPYIIGYTECGLPELIRYAPDEPKLKDVVKAVADFLADSQDPLGGWRYPHPRSSGLILSQGVEHAWQIVQADRALGVQEKHLDAIEKVLRQRILGWQKTGKMFAGLGGWEYAVGKVQPGDDLQTLYAHPEDRDFTKDYTDGSVGFGGGSPEGIVYFPEVLEFYLEHRPASRLLEAPKPDEPLGKVLARVAGELPKSDSKTVAPYGVKDNLPVFADKLAERLTFPMSWLSGNYKDFDEWKKTALAKVTECLLAPPPAAPFDAKVINEEDRGTYIARKIELNITGDSRVLAYMLVPKGKGPFPAVLLLHDHGARFDIGKEKVIKPFDCPPEKLASAEEWVNTCYGGRFIGDELAKRGYVCFATDMLNWSDRGGGGYEGQQALASNLLHLGTSFAGTIAYEDLRSAEFLAAQPEVDPKRVAAMGLSMGSFRTWQVAALSDRISAGVAICWMATVKGLMVPGNNQTGGQSAFTMTHPGLRSYLDYPDVASIACPKPMLFYNGLRDGLFPVPCVKDAYEKMHKVWESQGAGDKLATKLWDVPHCFSREMQDEAFAWLERYCGAGVSGN
jgi:hypothetical protein